MKRMTTAQNIQVGTKFMMGTTFGAKAHEVTAVFARSVEYKRVGYTGAQYMSLEFFAKVCGK